MHAIMYYFRRQLMEMSINDFAYSSLKQVKAQKGEKKKKPAKSYCTSVHSTAQHKIAWPATHERGVQEDLVQKWLT